MYVLYDADTDTLQTRTRRYDRDRTLARVIIPNWPTNTDADIALPHWVSEIARTELAKGGHDDCLCAFCDTVYDGLLDSFNL